jgi:hypothetical protein
MTLRKVPILDTDNKIKTTDLGGTGADSTKCLFGDKTWKVPGASSTNIKQCEIDFGTIPVSEKEFTIIDSDVLITSQITGNVAYEAPTGKELDELEMDSIDLKFAPGNGEFKIYAKGEEGYIEGKFKINYLIG